MLHGIGNLTLVSGKLNPSLSNAPWLSSSASTNSKRAALSEHSKLELHARLVRENPERWDEGSMSRRAAELFEVAKVIWPGVPTLGQQRAVQQVSLPVA
jgi:hypothetical protein